MTKPLYDRQTMNASLTAPATALAEGGGVRGGMEGRAADAGPLERIRSVFPILGQSFHGKPLAYLDNAATTQKPQAMIDAIVRYYTEENANIHRGVYALSELATRRYEEARETVRRFLNAQQTREIIFTRGATESINLVAATYGRKNVRPGDEVIISGMEHHSNIVPWQLLCEQAGAVLRVIPMNDRGELDLEEFDRLLGDRTRIVSVVHVSNSLGTINPVREIVQRAHRRGAVVLLDGAQWVAHGPTDVRELGCDFYAFSGHKVFGPTGIGVLYGKAKLLETMPPYQGGGDMISSVTFAKTEYNEPPARFEAGTPHIAGAVGLAAALEYVQSIGFDRIEAQERDLLEYATQRLSEIDGLRLIGTAREKASVVSFVMENPPIAALDVATHLDQDGIAVRVGHHCCQPVMDRFGIPGTVRASFAFYNTRQEVDRLVESLKTLRAAMDIRPAAKKTEESRVEWPGPAAESPQAAADELAEVFEILDDRDARNSYVLELAEKLPHTFEMLKTITDRVPGCMSEVYLVGRRSPTRPDAMEFIADANADIVRGLIAILQRIYSGQRTADILAFDIEAFFRRIGLDQFISSQRRNGLAGMNRRIRSLAEGLEKE